VPQDRVGYRLKWLRYYLDFCEKYRQLAGDPDSLTPFLHKLASKSQSREQQAEAAERIARKSMNFDDGVLTGHDGEGKKDRTVPPPAPGNAFPHGARWGDVSDGAGARWRGLGAKWQRRPAAASRRPGSAGSRHVEPGSSGGTPLPLCVP
jgi:hypothetical protein